MKGLAWKKHTPEVGLSWLQTGLMDWHDSDANDQIRKNPEISMQFKNK